MACGWGTSPRIIFKTMLGARNTSSTIRQNHADVTTLNETNADVTTLNQTNADVKTPEGWE